MDLYKIRKQLREGLAIEKIKLRVTSYSRVSTDHEEQKKSLVNQTEHFEEMIKKNDNWQYIPGYIDEGISGTSDKKRENFRRMIRDAKAGLFDLIITKEISRFSRNTLDSIKYTRELLENGVAVYFVNDNINTIMPDSELRLTIMASLAQDEVRRLSERVKFGMLCSIKKEKILGNNSLLGYIKDKDTGNLVINNDEAKIVKEIYKMYVIDKLSLNKIAKTLNIECKNRRWKAISIERIISNPKYKGYFCGKKTEVIDYISKKVKIIPNNEWIIYKKSENIPIIINEELWELANRRLLLRKRRKKTNTSYENNYLFSGKIWCLNDKMRFQRRRNCRASNDVSWLCGNYLKNGKIVCDTANIRESELVMILDQILCYLDIDKVYEILIGLYEKGLKRNSIVNNRLNNIDGKIKKLVDLYLMDGITKKEYFERYDRYNSELKIIKRDNGINTNKLRDKIIELGKTKEIKEKFIYMLVRRIEVKKENEIIYLRVILNISNELMAKIQWIFNEAIFSFYRGVKTKRTKRYVVNYLINIANN